MWGYRHWFIITFPFLCRKNQECNYFVFSLQVFPGALCRLSLSNNSIIFYFNFSRAYMESYCYCSSAVFQWRQYYCCRASSWITTFPAMAFYHQWFLIFYAIAKKKKVSQRDLLRQQQASPPHLPPQVFRRMQNPGATAAIAFPFVCTWVICLHIH